MWWLRGQLAGWAEGVLGVFKAMDLVALHRRGGQAQELDSLVDFCVRRVLRVPEHPLWKWK